MVVYLDNILIYLNNIYKYQNHIKKVLYQIWKTELYKAEKCEFYSNSVEYLEYILSSSRLTMAFNKIKTIQDWLKSKKIKNIQAFLRFVNFYCYFIYNYLDMATLIV